MFGKKNSKKQDGNNSKSETKKLFQKGILEGFRSDSTSVKTISEAEMKAMPGNIVPSTEEPAKQTSVSFKGTVGKAKPEDSVKSASQPSESEETGGESEDKKEQETVTQPEEGPEEETEADQNSDEDEGYATAEEDPFITEYGKIWKDIETNGLNSGRLIEGLSNMIYTKSTSEKDQPNLIMNELLTSGIPQRMGTVFGNVMEKLFTSACKSTAAILSIDQVFSVPIRAFALPHMSPNIYKSFVAKFREALLSAGFMSDDFKTDIAELGARFGLKESAEWNAAAYPQPGIAAKAITNALDQESLIFWTPFMDPGRITGWLNAMEVTEAGGIKGPTYFINQCLAGSMTEDQLKKKLTGIANLHAHHCLLGVSLVEGAMSVYQRGLKRLISSFYLKVYRFFANEGQKTMKRDEYQKDDALALSKASLQLYLIAVCFVLKGGTTNDYLVVGSGFQYTVYSTSKTLFTSTTLFEYVSNLFGKEKTPAKKPLPGKTEPASEPVKPNAIKQSTPAAPPAKPSAENALIPQKKQTDLFPPKGKSQEVGQYQPHVTATSESVLTLYKAVTGKKDSNVIASKYLEPAIDKSATPDDVKTLIACCKKMPLGSQLSAIVTKNMEKQKSALLEKGVSSEVIEKSAPRTTYLNNARKLYEVVERVFYQNGVTEEMLQWNTLLLVPVFKETLELMHIENQHLHAPFQAMLYNNAYWSVTDVDVNSMEWLCRFKVFRACIESFIGKIKTDERGRITFTSLKPMEIDTNRLDRLKFDMMGFSKETEAIISKLKPQELLYLSILPDIKKICQSSDERQERSTARVFVTKDTKDIVVSGMTQVIVLYRIWTGQGVNYRLSTSLKPKSQLLNEYYEAWNFLRMIIRDAKRHFFTRGGSTLAQRILKREEEEETFIEMESVAAKMSFSEEILDLAESGINMAVPPTGMAIGDKASYSKLRKSKVGGK